MSSTTHCKVAIFASGSGSNAEKIIEHLQTKREVSFIVISNKKEAGVYARAQRLKVPCFYFPKSSFENGEVLKFLKKENVSLIVLAGFLLLVPENLLENYPNKIINIHPALLPKYGGKGMYGMHVHQAVVQAKEKESGITIHYCNAHYDEGEIILQVSCPLLPTDTPEDVAHKVQALEHEYFPKVVEKLVEDIIRK
ncbi:MAG: phosphoribosylglycinamide formyltransferase [Flammeovirgaceae bacterium]